MTVVVAHKFCANRASCIEVHMLFLPAIFIEFFLFEYLKMTNHAINGLFFHTFHNLAGLYVRGG